MGTAANNLPAAMGREERTSRVRILIADEDAGARESARRALEPQRRIELVAEGHDVESAVTLTAEHSPHVVVFDYVLYKTAAARGFENANSRILTIVTLAAPDKASIIESFRLGAKGIILKQSPPRIWWRGIGAVLSGQYWLGSESLTALIHAIREQPLKGGKGSATRHFGLTPREIEIVRRIADGRSNKEVGDDCSIRERTVKHHLTNIFTKVGVSSRLELALFARDYPWLALANTAEPEEDRKVRMRERRNRADPRGKGKPDKFD